MRKSAKRILISIAAMFAVCRASADDMVEQTPVVDEEAVGHYEAEAELLQELHYSHEDFVRIYGSLPKDEDGKVDWERAVQDGLIDPAASINGDSTEERIMDLKVVVKFDDMLIKDVVFSHKVHTYWLNCESCHPKVFEPKVGANPMSMQDIRDGKYCGLCHGEVAFPTNVIDAPNFRANCLRCHRAQRG